jgi:hypothetical protein
MIKRESNGVYETEYMIVNGGFVIAEDYEPLSIPSHSGTFSVPAFHVLKVNEGHPLVLNNNGGCIGIYPKRDFDAMHGGDVKCMRFPAQWEKDRAAHDLASFFLTPVFDIPKKSFVRIIGDIDTLCSQGSILSYVEHGMHISQGNKRACNVMPSAVPNYFYHWLTNGHDIKYFDDKTKTWNGWERINPVPEKARSLVEQVNKLLEERFGVGFLLQTH